MKSVMYDKFVVNEKDDLYVTILVNDEGSFYGCNACGHHTPFGVCRDYNEFHRYLSMLTPNEVLEYRDDMGGNILHDMTYTNTYMDFFEMILNYVGYDDFCDLITMSDRSGICPLAQTTDLELFVYLLSFVKIDGKILEQISTKCFNSKILDYLAELINLSQ